MTITCPPPPPPPPSHRRGQLVDANGLLAALFTEDARPSLRWLRQMQAQRRIPYLKLGHLVRFDIEAVREALADHSTVRHRPPRRPR
jgi:hypothetical protein